MNFDYESDSFFLDKRFHFLTGAAEVFFQDASLTISSAFKVPQAISTMKVIIHAITFFSSIRLDNPVACCWIEGNSHNLIPEKRMLEKLKSNTADQNLINIVERRIKIHSITKGIVFFAKSFLIQKIGALTFHILKKENPSNLLFIGMHILSINYIFTLISQDFIWQCAEFHSLTDKIAECVCKIFKIGLKSNIEGNHTLESIYNKQVR